MAKAVIAFLSLGSLAACLAAPLLYFYGMLGEPEFKRALDIASAAWFVFATMWSARRGH